MTKYVSDLVTDLLNEYDIPYIALNPGSTFRGLLDSIINHGGGRPEIILCPHEKIAVQMAHGYAKATGRTMAVLLHNVVGLLHTNLAVYLANLDRAPILLLGATGPLAVGKRRPRIDWDHTAIVQAEAIRNYIKWDDQPSDVQGVIDSLCRGYRIARTEPQGPVYLCYDSALLEEPLHDSGELPGKSWAREHSRIGGEKDVIVEAARLLLSANNPVIIADLVGRYPECVETLVQLAELLAAPVIDLNGRFNFPNIHPLFSIDNDPLGEADVILALDVKDLHGCLAVTGDDGVTTTARCVPEDCTLIQIGTNELKMNGWSQGFQRFQPTDLSILADTRVALSQLLEECKIGETGAGRRSGSNRREERMKKWSDAHQAKRIHWQDVSRRDWDSVPMTPARMVSEVWEVIQHKDWVLTADTAKEWARRLWVFDKPYRHPGRSLGTAAKIGISLGVALAHKGSGKLVVNLQPDGDLMYDASSLWVAAHHRIPMLVIMYNNRSYYGVWEYQATVAKLRGRPLESMSSALELSDPAPDFAGLARAFGWYAEGPVSEGSALREAVERAVRVIEEEGTPALVDAVTRYR